MAKKSIEKTLFWRSTSSQGHWIWRQSKASIRFAISD